MITQEQEQARLDLTMALAEAAKDLRTCPKCQAFNPGEGCPGNFPPSECPNKNRSST
jgi:recombinational DNA repair protein RecR